MSVWPDIWFELALAQYPASGGTTTYRWSFKPLTDPSSTKEARLISLSDISRACTDQDGNYELTKIRVEVEDSDALLRGLLAAQTTQWWSGREAAVYLLSAEGRAAELEPRPLFRGVVTSVQLASQRRVIIECMDLVGSAYSAFNLDKTIPSVTIGDEHGRVPETSRGKVYPIIVGEHHDHDLIDEHGQPAAKGVLPVIDVGDYRLDGSDIPLRYLPPPEALTATLTGPGGTRTIDYAVTTLTDAGESTLSSTLRITNAPTTLDHANYLSLTWLPVTDATGYQIWDLTQGASVIATLGPDQSAFDDTGASRRASAAPTRNTALADENAWGRLIVCLGACQEILGAPYASDLAVGRAPKRVQMSTDLDGVEYLTPQSAGWPFPTPYLYSTNSRGETIRFTAIFVRGPRLKHHRDGVVTIAVNACGAEDIGDGTGAIYDEAFPALQWFLNEHVLKNGGTGYRDGDWSTSIESYANGDPQLQTTAFAAAQAVTVNRIGDRGYLAGWALTEPITVREFIRRFCLSFDCRLGINHWGQILPVVIDDMADPTAGRLYEDRENVIALGDQSLAHDELENRITYSYRWDADAKTYRVVDQVMEDAESIAAHIPGGVIHDQDRRGVREHRVQELFCVQDEATAVDSRSRRLTRNKRAPRYVPVETTLMGHEDELGDPFRLTHYDGLGSSGDVDTAMLTLKNTVHLRDPFNPSVTLVGFDVARVLGSAAATLEDEGGTVTFVLGDETVTAMPPTGAFELR